MTVMNHDPLADLEPEPTDAAPTNENPTSAPDPGPSPASDDSVAPPTPAEAAADETTIELGEALGIQEVAAAWNEWRPHLEHQGVPLPIDPGRLQEIDGTGLQLLCMLSRHRPLRWTTHSPLLHDAARLFGVSAALGLDTEGRP